MTIRQQKYKKNRLDGYSKYSSAVMAGYSKNTASRQAKRLDKVVNMEYWLEMQGLTDKKLAKHAEAGLNAMKVISCNVIAPSGEGMADAHGTTKDFIDVPDWPSRHKYYETILKLQGKIKNTPLIDQSKHTHKTFVYLDKKAVEEANAANNRIKTELPAE